MRDAFGGTYMLNFLMILFVIYVSLLAVAISWSKAFRIKNNIVTILEKPEYKDVDYTGSSSDSALDKEIARYLGTVSYNYNSNYDEIKNDCMNRGSLNKVEPLGICVVKKDGYYEVTSYFIIKAPYFNIKVFAPIRGETKLIDGLLNNSD